jgi:hypothetical protein
VPFSLRYYIVLLGICLAGCSHKGQFPHGNVLTDSVEHVFANTLFPWSCPSFQGGDGTSLEQAVVLSGNSVRFIADRARNDWISRNHPSDKISGSRILITGGEVVEIISIQTFSGASRELFFDITQIVSKPELGAWYFVATNGLERAGVIEEEYLSGTKTEPWKDAVDQMSGSLIYQIDDEIGNGMLATGELRYGEMHGTWYYERQTEGPLLIDYNMGIVLRRSDAADQKAE